jgi:hypothetical protein
MGNSLARIVLVTRRTPLEALLERFGTRGQAEFYLKSRGSNLGWAQHIHDALGAALSSVGQAIPAAQRRLRIDRGDLDRFLFAPDDVVVIVGQDGLVPNVAKYLRGQLVIGINPDPAQYDGVLCRHQAGVFAKLITTINSSAADVVVEERCMALAQREDGQSLRALNEVFVGHASHQSARYWIQSNGARERHSSSGVIAATGTGASGWARSMVQQRALSHELPTPVDPRLAWLVREPFPSVATGTELSFGYVQQAAPLLIESEMDEGGVIFADGMEGDRLEFLAGQRCQISLAPERLRLVI